MTSSIICWVRGRMRCGWTWRTSTTRHVTSNTPVLTLDPKHQSIKWTYQGTRVTLVRFFFSLMSSVLFVWKICFASMLMNLFIEIELMQGNHNDVSFIPKIWFSKIRENHSGPNIFKNTYIYERYQFLRWPWEFLDIVKSQKIICGFQVCTPARFLTLS